MQACGLATFGPVDLDEGSAEYGHIMATPKLAWRGFDVLGAVREALSVPVVIDTDVNGAALAEQRYGAAQGTRSSVYVTIGTGVGMGIIVHGESIRSPLHPEAGHMLIPRDAGDDDVAGCCPFHGDCLEGLASGPALRARWGVDGRELGDEHPAWELEAGYLAHMCVTLFRTLSPERIVIGGGVLGHRGLLARVRARFDALMGGYHTGRIATDSLICRPGLGDDAGLTGALELAQSAHRDSPRIKKGRAVRGLP